MRNKEEKIVQIMLWLAVIDIIAILSNSIFFGELEFMAII